MEKIVLEISKEGSFLSKEKGFLKIENNGQKNKVAFDNIFSVIISANDTVLSKNVLNELGAYGCLTVLCGKNYLPDSIVLPYSAHCLMSQRIKNQVDCSSDFKAVLWQSIVREKIKTQQRLILFFNPNSQEKERFSFLAKTILENDTSNCEGQAAKIYFKEVFGKQFVRKRESNDENMLLNYAYTILRSAVGRAISGAGLLPYIGLKHCNPTNQMPLLDDLIEPFRIVADYQVKQILAKQTLSSIELTPEIKREICKILTFSFQTEKGRVLLPEAIYLTVLSLVKSFEKEQDCLVFSSFDCLDHLC